MSAPDVVERLAEILADEASLPLNAESTRKVFTAMAVRLVGRGVTLAVTAAQERDVLHRLATGLGWVGPYKPYHTVQEAISYFKELRKAWSEDRGQS